MNPTCKAVPTATHQSGGASPLAPLLPGFRCSRMRVELLSHGGGGGPCGRSPNFLPGWGWVVRGSPSPRQRRQESC